MLDNILRLVCLCFEILLWNLRTGIYFGVKRNSSCFYFAFMSQLCRRMCLYDFIINWMSWLNKLTEVYWRKTINLTGFILLINNRCMFWGLRSCTINICSKVSLKIERLLIMKIVGRKMAVPICFQIMR